MRYTKFFASINRDVGLQRISNVQLGRVMNIVFLEGELKGLDESVVTFKHDLNPKGIELLKFKIGKRVSDLTGNRDPKVLMKEIYYLSEKDI